METKYVTVVGAGYVGLVTAAYLAEIGHSVTVIDIDKEKIENLKKGKIPIYEPELDCLLKKNIAFSTEFTVLSETNIVFIAVGTPQSEDGSANLNYLMECVNYIEKNTKKLNEQRTLIIKSTVPIGTNEKVKKLVTDTIVVNNPEFLREGSAIKDTFKPDRIVIGVENKNKIKIENLFYSLYHDQPKDKFLFCSPKSAELIKHGANAMLATRIAFINELSDLCESYGANINEVKIGIGTDSRIGPKFLEPGPGYGGSCFPKDTRALLKTRKNTNQLKIVQSVILSNENRRKEYLKNRLELALNRHCNFKSIPKIAVLGLAFKPNTDDCRETPAIPFIKYCLKRNYKVYATDPIAELELKDSGYSYEKNSIYSVIKDAEALVLVTDWPHYAKLDWISIYNLMGDSKIIIDGRNYWNPKELKSLGFQYFGVGI